MEEPLPRQDSSVHGLGEDFLKGNFSLILRLTFSGGPNPEINAYGGLGL